MIVLDCQLWSANRGDQSSLGLMIIDNIGVSQDRKLGDYRVRTWRKGTTMEEVRKGAKPLREGRVLGHRRLSESPWRLVQKALKAMNYD